MGIDMDALKEKRNDEWRKELREKLSVKERRELARLKMPEKDPMERIKGFMEVNNGLSLEEARAEARRCLDCANPTCVTGCPVNINIPEFIKRVEQGKLPEAAESLKSTNALPAVCGRVCPQETQCEEKCIYTKMKKEPVGIGNLERFVADYERESDHISVPRTAPPNHIKVAVVGSGPAGLTVAQEMAKAGYEVTVFEALHQYGGVLVYGIPEFRLPKNIVSTEIGILEKMGVEFRKNCIIGKTITFEDLRSQGYKAFFIGSGAGLPRFMNIPGENLCNIFSSNEYLTRVNLMTAFKFPEYDTPIVRGKNVIVVGGGNTAMDSVRTAKRLGANRAIIMYRRSEQEMPARIEEIKHAKEEGVEFMNLNNPVEYIGDEQGFVKQVRVQRMELGEPDSSGRRRPVPIEGDQYLIDVDVVVVGIGTSPNPLIPQSLKDVKVSRWGTLEVDESTMETSLEGVFAGGDIVRGGATVILAMGDGKVAADAMQDYLCKES